MWKAETFLEQLYRGSRPTPEDDQQKRRKLMEDQEDQEDQECPICFETYTVQRVLKILNCGHFVCEDCWDNIATIGNQHLRCPLCRSPQPGFEDETETNEDIENVVGVEIVQRGRRSLPYLIIMNFPMQTDTRVTRTEFFSLPNYPDLRIGGFPNDYDIVPVPNQNIYTELVALIKTFNKEQLHVTYLSVNNQIKFPFTHWNDRTVLSQAVSQLLSNHGITFNISIDQGVLAM